MNERWVKRVAELERILADVKADRDNAHSRATCEITMRHTVEGKLNDALARAVKAEAKLARIRSEAEHPSSWTSQLSASKVLAILADNEGGNK